MDVLTSFDPFIYALNNALGNGLPGPPADSPASDRTYCRLKGARYYNTSLLLCVCYSSPWASPNFGLRFGQTTVRRRHNPDMVRLLLGACPAWCVALILGLDGSVTNNGRTYT